jgi:hypothetical protein
MATLGFLKPCVEACWGSHLRKALSVSITTFAAIALLSRSPPPASQSSARTMAYENTAPVTRAPLSPPAGYTPPSGLSNLPTPLVPFEDSVNDGAGTEGLRTWHASPRWAAIQGDGCIVVEQDQQPDLDPEGKIRVRDCSKENGDD